MTLTQLFKYRSRVVQLTSSPVNLTKPDERHVQYQVPNSHVVGLDINLWQAPSGV